MNARRLLPVLFLLALMHPLPASSQVAGDADSLAAQGRQALAQGRYPDAQAAFEKLARLKPSIAEVHATLAVIDFKLRAYEQAVAEIRAALKLKPTLPRLDSLLGLSLAELGRFEEALPKLEKGFKQTADTETRRLCGLQLLRIDSGLDRDQEAVAVALELNKAFPDDPEVLYHTGRAYGAYAYIVMERLHDKAPNSIWMLQAQGEANESQKNWDAALAAFQSVVQLEPRRPGAHYRLGRVYLSRFREAQHPEDRESAAHEFSAELSLDPANGNAAYELAVLSAELGRLDEAREHFESLLSHFPDFEEALVGLGGCYLDLQKPDLAIAPLIKATQVRPADEVAWYRLSQAYRATGNRDQQQHALAEFRRLHSTTPTGMRKPTAASEITPQQVGPDANTQE